MKSIEFLNTGRHDFGKDLDSIDVELSNPNTFVQSLLKLGSFLHGKTIESFDNPKNYPPITLPPLQTPVEIEEHRKNTTFDQNYNSLYYRQSSAQNIKINEIANDLESGKIIGKKIISNAFDLSVSYRFIILDGLKNLKERLFIDIINVINQKKRVALNHAQIDDIQYNVLDSAFYFIFDVGNPSHLAIKVPRKSLENDELPNTKKNIFNGLIKTIYGCIDDENAFLELENDKTINDLNHQDLWEKLKTQAFPLSDIITNAINQKEGVALDYALINDIKYNLFDNTFHFIFVILICTYLHLIDD